MNIQYGNTRHYDTYAFEKSLKGDWNYLPLGGFGAWTKDKVFERLIMKKTV